MCRPKMRPALSDTLLHGEYGVLVDNFVGLLVTAIRFNSAHEEKVVTVEEG
jgi:hypothetical protein